jgi:hypothetical protein
MYVCQVEGIFSLGFFVLQKLLVQRSIGTNMAWFAYFLLQVQQLGIMVAFNLLWKPAPRTWSKMRIQIMCS